MNIHSELELELKLMTRVLALETRIDIMQAYNLPASRLRWAEKKLERAKRRLVCFRLLKREKIEALVASISEMVSISIHRNE